MDVNLKDAFSLLSDMARKENAEVELLVERGETLSLKALNGKLDKFDSSQSHVAGIRVILGGVEGYCWTESLETSDLVSAYREAIESARFAARGQTEAERAKHAVELFAGNSTEIDDELLANCLSQEVPLAEKIKRAIDLEQRPKLIDSRISSVPYNGYNEYMRENFVFNSRGVCAHQKENEVYAYSYALGKRGEETRQGGQVYFGRDATKVPIEEIAKRAVEKTVSKLGATPPETGKYPIVIDRDQVGHLVGVIADYFSAKSVAEKTSIFAGDRGQVIASPLFNLVDDPKVEGGMGNRSFDGEGAPTMETVIVEGGVLKSFMTNSVYAKRLGLPHTANAARSAKGSLDIGYSNLVVKPGNQTFEQLLASAPKLIYVTDFAGFHSGFRHGSGDFSFQAQGELWENGKRVRALCDFVVSGSVRDLLKGIKAVSSRMSDIHSRVIAPDLLIDSLSVAGAKS